MQPEKIELAYMNSRFVQQIFVDGDPLERLEFVINLFKCLL